ncbi:MAG: DEAD/DEAH box helicase [Thermodesulfobacteriota bacterium]
MPEDLETQQTARANTPRFLTQTRFDDFQLPEQVLAGLKDAGFTLCTPIQAQVLPLSLTGSDVAGQAQTGTGKTAAFLVTIFNRLLSDAGKKKEGLPSALIVAPTRELALQIYDDAKLLGGHTGLTLAQVVGGIDYKKQADLLRQGPDIVICTPGRIIDYLKQGIFKPAGINSLVIDEADRLFDLGFTKDMRYILRKLPHYDKRQSMLFSATLSYRVLELTYEYMNLPEVISVTPEEVVVDGIEQSLYHVGRHEKLELLLGLLNREDWERALIFSNTKAGVEWLTRKLRGNGFPAEGITGDLPQPKRLSLMGRFKAGKVKILVATDVASRGIHVEDITHVINYDLPQDSENYIHRIGRTARAGKKGRALTMACERYVYHLEPLEEMLGYKLPVVWPEEDWFVEDKAGHVPRGERKDRRSPPRPHKPKRETRPREPARKRRPPLKQGRPQPPPEPPESQEPAPYTQEGEQQPPAGDDPGTGRKPGSRSRRRRPPKKKAMEKKAVAKGTDHREPATAPAPKKEPEMPGEEPPGGDAPKPRPKKQPGPSGKKIATSSQPGGVFGLAPSPSGEQEAKPAKKGRRKRKKKPSPDPPEES